MGKRVDLSKEIVTKNKINRKLTTYTSRSFFTTNIVNGITTESEETNESQEIEQNTAEENNSNENNDNNNDNATEKSEENNEKSDNSQDLNENSTTPSTKKETLQKAKEMKERLDKLRKTNKKTKDAKTLAAILKNPLTLKILLIVLVIAMGILGFVLLISIITNMSNSSIAFGGMYNIRCKEMTVIFVDKNNGYEVTGSQTYSLTDYVAGVVAAEVGGFVNKEVYKTYALAARTFGLMHASEDCTIEGSARRQAFKDITESTDEASKLIYEAVQETEGQVLISNNDLYSIAYDAFCYIDKDSNYYTLSQKGQKIPTDWVESNIGNYYYKNCPCNANDKSMTDCWSSSGSWRDGGHGSGMSQYGAYYLAKELGYTYDEILNYYFGDDGVTISSNYFLSSIAGLEIKDTTNGDLLYEPITTFLESRGSSLEELNSFVYNSVKENGVGTRAGVVTAAVSMINYLYDNFNTSLPYYWGGSSQTIGLPKKIGIYSPSSASSYTGKTDYHISFDCSGFVSWVIKNGGYELPRLTTVGFHDTFAKNSCNIRDENCIGQPGDLINSRGCHVQMIIAVDQENGKYYIAESSGSVAMKQWGMHTSNCGNKKETRIIHMDEYYNNPNNINPNY